LIIIFVKYTNLICRTTEKISKMEYVNNPITPLDESLSHMSNVLDNFEHTKCGKLLQTEFHVSL